VAELQVHLSDSTREYAGAQVASGRFPTMNDYLGALVSADEQAQRVITAFSDNPELASLLEEGLASEHGRRWSPIVLNELKQQILDQAARKST